MFPTNPPAIVWTETKPAYRLELSHYSASDIRAIQSWLQRETELSTFRKFRKNWDGFDAAAPHGPNIDRAISFLRTLRQRDPSNPPKRVVLSSEGLVALEWVEGNKFLQAEIGDSAEVEWMIAVPGQPTQFEIESLEADGEPEIVPEAQAWLPPATVAADELDYASAH